MGHSGKLTLIGYWDGPLTDHSWPNPADFIDESWDADERDFIADYLGRGQLVFGFMGYSMCRMCGRENGDLELSDGKYLWPDGLVHYVADHGVRLPSEFVRHAYQVVDDLAEAGREVEWWRSIRPGGNRTVAPWEITSGFGDGVASGGGVGDGA